jgi:hypothetical protein
MTRLGLGLLLMLAACSKSTPVAAPPTTSSSELERAAIAAGVIPDPNDTDITGLYARDTDRLCVVPDRDGYRIGAFVDYGDAQSCTAKGRVSRSGEKLHIAFDGGCSLDASFDGASIQLPGEVPAPCRTLCTGHASLAALDAERLSDSVSEASTLRDAKGRMLCGG